MDINLPKRYRIEDPYTADGIPALVVYYVVKKTPSGAWIAPHWAVCRYPLSHDGQAVTWDKLPLQERKYLGVRFVLDGDGKRWAHETEEQARYSYKRRKLRQIAFAKASINKAENGLHWLRTDEAPQPEMVPFFPQFQATGVNGLF